MHQANSYVPPVNPVKDPPKLFRSLILAFKNGNGFTCTVACRAVNGHCQI
jgi:hypothetical protein